LVANSVPLAVVTTVLAIVAVAFGMAGALGFYLASPNQKLRAQHLPLRVGAGVGAAGMLVSLLSLLQVAGPATSVYLLLTLLMFLWSVVPLIAGWWRYRQSRET